MKFRSKQKQEEGEETSFWISYADILSSLLIIILLITVYVIFELMQTKQNVTESLEEITKAELVRKEVLTDIQLVLKEKGIEVEIADNYSILRIPESTLTFASNNYNVPVSMQNELGLIGKVILEVLSQDSKSDFFDTIFIEGHTDIRPTNRVMGNLGLSTFRAISVWNYWKNFVSQRYSDLENLRGDKLFSVGGYGETRPTTDQQTNEEEFRKNRRIDVRFTLRQPSSIEYKNVMKLFDEN